MAVNKKAGRCRSCDQPLHKLIHAIDKGWTGAYQCINQQCKQYGKARW